MPRLSEEILGELKKKQAAPAASEPAEDDEDEGGSDLGAMFADVASALDEGDNEAGGAALKRFIRACSKQGYDEE